MAEYCDSFVFSEINQDHYEMVPNETDSFQFWQGLRGPYYTPFVGEDGYLYWSNTGQLPNPEPVRIVGKNGRGITLTGQCETVAELPEDPEQGEAWAVGEAEPFECYAWFGEWVDMGLLFPAGQDGISPAVTITTTATGHKVKITDRDHPSGQEFNVDDGDPGQDGISPAVTITTTATGHKVKITDRDHPSGQEFNVDDGEDGQDGISPAVTISATATGHKVKITDRDHPSGQEFNVDDGEDGDPGPGVPPGGSAGQFYRKASSTDYDGEWHTLSAGDSSYDNSLTYAAGTVGEELSSQRNTLNDKAEKADLTNISQTRPNCTVTNGIAKGTYFYLDDVLTRATVAISENAPFTSSNCETVTAGGLNALKDSIDEFKIVTDRISISGKTVTPPGGTPISVAPSLSGYDLIGITMGDCLGPQGVNNLMIAIGNIYWTSSVSQTGGSNHYINVAYTFKKH